VADEHTVVSWSGLQVKESATNDVARTDLRKAAKEQAFGEPVPDTGEPEDVSVSPLGDNISVADPGIQVSPQQIYGEIAAATPDTAQQIYDKYGLDDVFVPGMTATEWQSEIADQLSKLNKNASITPSAAAGEAGTSVGFSKEAAITELNRLYAGEFGSFTDPKNQKRLRELTRQLGQ